MPPTIQNNLNAEREKRPPRPAEKRSDLICRVKYCNTLPDIPFDPKFITYPFESRRFIEYNPTSLERNYKYEVLTEHDLGVTIDLINKDLYAPDYGQILDPADEKLLEEDILTQQDSKRSRHHGRSVSWLRRTEYISTEQTRFQPQTMDKVEAKVGYSIKKNFKDETLYMDRESQIKAINKTFDDSKKAVEQHYSKPNVVPVEILPVFPDFKLWKYPCAQVIFDSDPAPTGRPIPAQIEEMSQAMIRGVMDESGEQFVAYFLPTDSTLEKRRTDFQNNVEYVDDEEYEYKMAREYNWNVKSKASKGYEENYFLVMRPDGVYYNELETRVRLSKRRQKAGQQVNNTRLVVCHRTLNAAEFKMQRYREKQLEAPNEEEEEEEEDEEEEDTQEQANNKSDDENKSNTEKDKESHNSRSENDDSDKEERGEGKGQNEESDKEGSEKARTDSDREKGESDKEDSENEKGDSDHHKADSEDEKPESDNEKVDSENEKPESDHEKADSEHEKPESDHEKADSENEKPESDNERAHSENAESDHEKADSEQEMEVSENEDKEESEKEESDAERHDSDQEHDANIEDKQSDRIGETRSSNSSESGSGSENEAENTNLETGDKADVASHSSGSRSSSRSRSQSRPRSHSRSPSASASASASASDSE